MLSFCMNIRKETVKCLFFIKFLSRGNFAIQRQVKTRKLFEGFS